MADLPAAKITAHDFPLRCPPGDIVRNQHPRVFPDARRSGETSGEH
ncbi:MAG: hypothetical protein LBI62_00980 [Candidatus Accumulibacter sp.]|nr:hypothetical protein [Accumulibacter sp.]